MADYVRDTVVRCWNIPADAMDAGPVTIRFKLNRYGKVVGTPKAAQAVVAQLKLDADDKIVGKSQVSAAPQEKKARGAHPKRDTRHPEMLTLSGIAQDCTLRQVG